jgi:RNA polymerase sigma factor (sigma-70 family)
MSALSTRQLAPTCTDTELVAAVRGGSDRAFEELYSRYRSRIGAYIQGIVSDHARAEDIAQEVFISALRRLRETERPIAFKAWIYEIAKNACIDEYRRVRRAREVPLEPEDDDSGDQRRMLSGGQAPDAAVERKQVLDDLRGAFHGLSESHHRIIVMREFEGLSYSQIGDRLGISRPVVESTLFRARRRLSKEYDELVSGRRCDHVQALIATGEPKSLLKLGLRERRRLGRHLSHCQPCRREARLAGVDDSLFHAPGLAGKIAALLPIPWLRWRRGVGHRNIAGRARGYSATLLQPFQSLARFGNLVDPSSVIGRVAAAAAAAVAALAGLGGVVVAVAHHAPAPPRVAPTLRSRAPTSAPAPRHSSSSRARAATQPNPGASPRSHAHTAGASQTGSGRGAAGTAGASATPAGGGASTGSASHGAAPAKHSVLGISIPRTSSSPAGSVLKKVTKPISGVVKKVSQPVSGVLKKISQPVSSVLKKATQPVSGVLKKVSQPVSGVVKKVTSTPPVSQLPQKVSVPGAGSVTVPKVSVPNPTKMLSP